MSGEAAAFVITLYLARLYENKPEMFPHVAVAGPNC